MVKFGCDKFLYCVPYGAPSLGQEVSWIAINKTLLTLFYNEKCNITNYKHESKVEPTSGFSLDIVDNHGCYPRLLLLNPFQDFF